MARASIATRVVAGSADQDRLSHRIERDAELVVLADGAGGVSGGREAAEELIRSAAFELSESQHRKPLLGSGAARPVGFGPHYLNDRLLVASDGLYKYVPFSRIKALALLDPLERAIDELVAAARLPSGGLAGRCGDRSRPTGVGSAVPHDQAEVRSGFLGAAVVEDRA
jgi:serine/threonine protein phosphatase PrpC